MIFFLLLPNFCWAVCTASCPHDSIIVAVQHHFLAFTTLLISIYTGRMDDNVVWKYNSLLSTFSQTLSMLHLLFSCSFSGLLFFHCPLPLSFTSFSTLSFFQHFLFQSFSTFPYPIPPTKRSPWVYLLSRPVLSTCPPYPSSHTFYHHHYFFSVFLLSCPLPTCRTIRRSTWSTYTAGLTACAPRMKAPTSSSPPLPSI